MSKPAIPQLARGIGTSDLWVVVLVLLGIDVDTATAIMGGVPDTEQIKAIIAMLHGEGWQVLLIKGALAGAYLWVRDRNKKAGIEFEIEKLRLPCPSPVWALRHRPDKHQNIQWTAGHDRADVGWHGYPGDGTDGQALSLVLI